MSKAAAFGSSIVGRELATIAGLPARGVGTASAYATAWGIVAFCGQSGLYTSESGLKSPPDGNAAGVYAWPATGTAWTEAAEPIPHEGTPGTQEIGPCAAVGREMRGHVEPFTNIMLISGAETGSGFADTRWNDGDDLFNALEARVAEALAFLPGAYMLALVMQLGARDAVLNRTQAQFAADYDACIAAYRLSWSASAMPVLCCPMADDHTPGTHLQIRAAIEDTPNRVTSSAWVNATGLGTSDGTHWAATSMRTLGARYATAYGTI